MTRPVEPPRVFESAAEAVGDGTKPRTRAAQRELEPFFFVTKLLKPRKGKSMGKSRGAEPL